MKKRNFVDKNLRQGETGWKPSKQVHKSKKKYTRKLKHRNVL